MHSQNKKFDKEIATMKNLRAAREKRKVIYNGTPLRLLAVSQKKLFRPGEKGMTYSKYLKKTTANLEFNTNEAVLQKQRREKELPK